MSDMIVLAVWSSVGVMNAGFFYAFPQRQYPRIAEENRTGDCVAAWIVGFAFAPISFPAIFLFALWRHGWLFPGANP